MKIPLTGYLPSLRSLSLRVIMLSTLWTIISFVAIATIISTIYGEARLQSFKQLLSAHLFSVIASVSVNDGTLAGRPDPGEVRYSSPLSGWYWSVEPVADNLKGSLKSVSLGDWEIDSPRPSMFPSIRPFNVPTSSQVRTASSSRLSKPKLFSMRKIALPGSGSWGI